MDVRMPDGTVIKNVPEGTTKAQLEGKLSAGKPQPSAWDRVTASPVGRLAHDAVAAPIQALLPILGGIGDSELGLNIAKGHPLGRSGGEAVANMAEVPYQGALERNRNTPGYSAARAEADAMMAKRGGSGFQDQVLAPFTSAMAGAGGGLFGGSFDASNAAADSQTASQGDYAQRHPALSFGANVLGGFVAPPEVGMSRLFPARAAASAAPNVPPPGGGAGSPLQLPPLGPPGRPFAAPTRTPDQAAVEYVQRQIGGPAELRAFAAQAGNKPVLAAEASRRGEVAIGALARREGKAPDALSGMAKARNAAAPNRIMDDYAAASGIHPQAARGDIEGFIESNQKAASPLYAEAEKANPNIASPMLDRILETPAGKKALADARERMQNDMSLMGTPDADLMEQAAEGGTAIPKRGVASGMKLKAYQYIKEALDDQVSAAYRAGEKAKGNSIRDLKNTMLSELDKADVTAKAGPNSLKPEGGAYARARAKAGEYLGAKKQFELGQAHILDDKFPAQDFVAHLKKLGEADQQAYMGGVANKLFNLQQSGKLKADIFKSPGIRQKLSAAMGQEKADAFIRNMETEEKMANFVRQRAPGAGSPTAEYQQAMIDQDGSASMATDLLKGGEDLFRGGVTTAVGNFAARKAKDAMAGYLTRGMQVPVRDRAFDLLSMSPQDLAAYLESLPVVKSQPMFQPPQVPRGLFGSSRLPSGQGNP